MTTDQERVAFYKDRGVQYYLRTENEARHEINRQAGLDRLISNAWLESIARHGSNELYQFNYSRLPE